MKKCRIIFLVLLYIFLLLFTLVMEWLAIQEILVRAVVNLCTLGMTVVGSAVFIQVYKRGVNKEEEPDKPKEIPQPVFDREIYLAFAKEKMLTRRETEIGLLAANGYSNHRIAEELFISETTVKKHLTHIYEKTGACGRKELQKACYRNPQEERADS